MINTLPNLKNYFKTREGKHELRCEKTARSVLLLLDGHTKVTLAHLKDKPTEAPPSQSSSSSLKSSSLSDVTPEAARLLAGGGTGGPASSSLGGDGGNKSVLGTNGDGNSNFDGKGTYLVFNVGDGIFISDFNSQDKYPIKSIHFSNSNPVCHSFDPDTKDGHDLLIGFNSGDVYSVSLREQLQDVGKMLVGAHHYNKDVSVDNSRCTGIAWIPNGDGSFVVAHVNGNMYVYNKNKDGNGDPSFSVIKDPTQFSVYKNPVARWHICEGSINGLAFSADGAYLATVGRDGYLRVFDYTRELLICGGKSYYAGLLCCAWSADGKFILTGGEDDLVHVWSMEARKFVAWGEGHSSWVSGVAFDSYWSDSNSDGVAENVIYRFGSVGQDTKLLLWDLQMDELLMPVRRTPGGTPTSSTGNQSFHCDSTSPVGVLQPSLSNRDVPKLSPLVNHRAAHERLTGLIFTPESILTVCRQGDIKIWTRPSSAESQPSNFFDPSGVQA